MYTALLTVIAPAMPLAITTALVLLGIGYATFALVLQRKLSNPAKAREIQQKIQALTKELNAMAKRGEDISAKQSELMPMLNESMKSQMKSMFVILPVFFVIYYGIMPLVFGKFSADMVTLLVLPLNYGGLFIATAIITGLIYSAGIMIRDRTVAKRMKAMQAQQPQQSQQPKEQQQQQEHK